ncbi:hypothetical protein BSK56_02590 [Paenibacillus borealis]|uniref:Transposase n=1 Tax=Paenibacillus borealis TaxID=160799 RepID=A0ABX3HQK8_PAEBO|nr:hypothetical protein BSK56_02590 [Paenibacillus borealis]
MNWFFGIIFYNILSKYGKTAGKLKGLSDFFNSLLFSLPHGRKWLHFVLFDYSPQKKDYIIALL